MVAATLFFWAAAAGPSAAAEAAEDLTGAMTEYVTKMILALLLLCAAGYAAVKYLPGRLGGRGARHLKVISAVSLGREMVYIVKTGPEIVALFSGKAGAVVLGRWSLEEWDDYGEASLNFPARPEETEK
jgi:hypothetical protein